MARSDPIAVDIVSDVVCPWCYIGKRKFEIALERLHEVEPRIELAVRWHPFQLNPDLPAEGVSRAEYLAAKFGPRSGDIYSQLRTVGREVGIDFAFERIVRQPNTLDAHRLIAWAQQTGEAGNLVERLFRAYFVEGRFIGSRSELTEIAQEAGYAAAEVSSVLDSDQLTEIVVAENREAKESGINAVPFFIFNGRTAVSGAHEPETLLDTMNAARSAA